ncbi:MAG: PF20097 family protein [Acidobacteriota bacterium]|nr:PF20097 family protein [Acidobacteriota bacterium]
MPPLNCPRCRGELVAGGAVYGPGRMAFRPQDSKFFTLQTGDVMTKAMMCRECGVIEFVGDVAKLKRLLVGGADPTPGPNQAS